mmetsp:Transcript_5937/g.8391  ORF Transcript_5937/g.8391 Transcript_5937/m.8391 type:complete len:106 (-) Transcript_5937:997-1314(-)
MCPPIILFRAFSIPRRLFQSAVFRTEDDLQLRVEQDASQLDVHGLTTNTSAKILSEVAATLSAAEAADSRVSATQPNFSDDGRLRVEISSPIFYSRAFRSCLSDL